MSSIASLTPVDLIRGERDAASLGRRCEFRGKIQG